MKNILPKLIVIIIVLVVVFSFKGPSEPRTEEELEERIGQMILIGFRGTEVLENSYIVKVIREVKIGGLVFYERNILNPEQVKKLISTLQHYSEIPLFIAVGAEGGRVNRLKPKYGFSDFYSAEKLGKIKDYKFTKQEALRLSRQLKELGFNMNFAPVVDVNINPQNPIIGALGRSFSEDPYEVASHTQAFIEAHHQNNIIATAKHFPGHGSSEKDSHLGMVDVTDVYQENELIPYKHLQEKGLLDAVMTAHIINRRIDRNYPATLSAIFLQDALRKQIGFKGVIISDDMEMGAISKYYGLEEAVVKAINAGCDIVLFSNTSQSEFDGELAHRVRNIIYQAVNQGKISKQRIVESSNRIYKLKKRFKIIQSP